MMSAPTVIPVAGIEYTGIGSHTWQLGSQVQHPKSDMLPQPAQLRQIPLKMYGNHVPSLQ